MTSGYRRYLPDIQNEYNWEDIKVSQKSKLTLSSAWISNVISYLQKLVSENNACPGPNWSIGATPKQRFYNDLAQIYLSIYLFPVSIFFV
jgi:hypothetical protein